MAYEHIENNIPGDNFSEADQLYFTVEGIYSIRDGSWVIT